VSGSVGRTTIEGVLIIVGHIPATQALRDGFIIGRTRAGFRTGLSERAFANLAQKIVVYLNAVLVNHIGMLKEPKNLRAYSLTLASPRSFDYTVLLDPVAIG
jgi:hypothetical protein